MGKGKGHVPLRTCVSCGTKRAKKELIRLVVDKSGRLVRDELGREKGRGAYICNTSPCGEQLLKNKRLRRTLRLERDVTVGAALGETKERRDEFGSIRVQSPEFV